VAFSVGSRTGISLALLSPRIITVDPPMRAVVFAILAFVVAQGASAQDYCAGQSASVDACYAATRTGYQCLWQDDMKCFKDKCAGLSQNNCLAQQCLYLQGSQPVCMNPKLVCNLLSNSECQQTNLCNWRSTGYCASATEPVVGKTSAECDLEFPQWSIALIIIWICIMVILGFIIFLIINKGRQRNVGPIENSGVVVESVNLRDNFNLQQPLTQNAA
jgi:hypothetical protein